MAENSKIDAPRGTPCARWLPPMAEDERREIKGNDMKHFEIDAHWPDGHTQVVRYAENWRKVRALLREQRVERPTCTFTVRRITPEARWVRTAFTYRDLREYERSIKGNKNGHHKSA